MNRNWLLVATLGGVLLTAAGASAQAPPAEEPRSERPYLGIFGGGIDRFEQVLSVNGSAGVGYDTSPGALLSETGLPVQPVFVPAADVGTGYSHFSGGLSYNANVKKLGVAAALSSSMRRYLQAGLPNNPNHAVSVGSSLNGVNLGKKTSLSGSVTASYQSLRGFMPFPDLASAAIGPIQPPVADYGTGRQDYYTYVGSASVAHQLSPRSAVTAGYSRQSSRFGQGVDNIDSQSGSFRFTHGLTSNLNLRLGYGYTAADYNNNLQRYEYHNLDTGVDYSRALSLTRRTRLSFSTGATATRQDQQTRYDAVGSAVLDREIGRTWKASFTYNRNVQFLESVLQPVFSDAISAGLGGLITRRLTFHSGVSSSRGSVGVQDRPSNGFDAWTGFAGLNQALTRNLALSVNYSYYHYNFQPGAALLTRLAPNMDRQSVNVMLNAWAPIFQHGRKQNAAR